MTRWLLACCFLTLINISGKAQERDKRDSLRYYYNSITIIPQYLARQAVRIDWEIPLVKGGQVHRLVVSPYWYAGNTDRYSFNGIPSSVIRPDGYGDTRVDGFGLEILDKYTLRLSQRNPSKFYLAFGLGYHRVALDYINYEPAPFTENGTTLFRYGFTDQEETINRLEAVGLIGMKIFSRHNILFLDFFIGPVIKRSWVSTESVAPLSHNRFGDHGFNGVAYQIGAGLGVVVF